MKLGLWGNRTYRTYQTYQTYPTCWTCEILVEGIWLEGHGEAGGDLAAGEVVWHGVLNVVYVGNPVIAAHVGNVE